MTNLFFQTTSIISRTVFKVSLNIISAVCVFAQFVRSNVLILQRGTYPEKQVNNALMLICYCRLNPQDVGTSQFVQEMINTIGVPYYFQNLFLLLPLGQISLRGIFSIQFDTNLSQSMIQRLKSSFQGDLLTIRSYFLQNGIENTRPNISGSPSKKTEISVFLDNGSGIACPTVNMLGKSGKFYAGINSKNIGLFFPSSTGYVHSLTWLFALLFRPIPKAESKADVRKVVSDFSRFVNANFTACLTPEIFSALQNNILIWYFDGNTVVFQTPKLNPNQPRNPQTGERSVPKVNQTGQLQQSQGQRPRPKTLDDTASLQAIVKTFIREIVLQELNSVMSDSSKQPSFSLVAV